MNTVFYIAAAVAIISTLLAITRMNTVHALLHMIVSLLATSLIFFVLGAPYVAALQTIVYAGAIMVLFVFTIMMLNQGPQSAEQEQAWFNLKAWVGPALLSGVLLLLLVRVVRLDPASLPGTRSVEPKEVSLALFGPYILAVELISLLLLAGLIGAYHIGRREPQPARGPKR
jgi:NADH-quinone oxidoreductase subunit J